jgi:hypothetical protein
MAGRSVSGCAGGLLDVQKPVVHQGLNRLGLGLVPPPFQWVSVRLGSQPLFGTHEHPRGNGSHQRHLSRGSYHYVREWWSFGQDLRANGLHGPDVFVRV